VMHYEKADWQNFAEFTQKLNFDEKKIPDLYLNAVRWAEKTLKA
jgi:c-di-GMP-related signal transduction protein